MKYFGFRPKIKHFDLRFKMHHFVLRPKIQHFDLALRFVKDQVFQFQVYFPARSAGKFLRYIYSGAKRREIFKVHILRREAPKKFLRYTYSGAKRRKIF